MTKCLGCGTMYDPSEYGRFKKYCSTKCKHTDGGTKELHRKPGRPRRFQPLLPAIRLLVIDHLRTCGWIVDPSPYEGIVVVRRGLTVLSVALGSLGRRLENKTHAVAQYRCNVFTFESSCVKGRKWDENPARMDGKTIPRLLACRRCAKCQLAQWLNESTRKHQRLPRLLFHFDPNVPLDA